jgi:hypothetical protein
MPESAKQAKMNALWEDSRNATCMHTKVKMLNMKGTAISVHIYVNHHRRTLRKQLWLN